MITYMNNVLIATSNPIYLDLGYYTEGHSIDKGLIFKDSYLPSKIKTDHGVYRLMIESPVIRDDADLERQTRSIRVLSKRLTLLTKCVLGRALNTSPWEVDLFTKEIQEMGYMPFGWSSNYPVVRDELDKKKKLHLQVVEIEPRLFYTLDKSPFQDFKKSLTSFPKLKMIEKDLLRLLNDADLISFTGRYMLLSKALEIVNAMYPLKGKDDRIQTLLPELVDQFKGTTIKDMLNLANNRKETRHYVDKSKETLSHPAMTEDELKLFYSFTNQLCLNLIRRSLGLGLVDYGID